MRLSSEPNWQAGLTVGVWVESVINRNGRRSSLGRFTLLRSLLSLLFGLLGAPGGQMLTQTALFRHLAALR